LRRDKRTKIMAFLIFMQNRRIAFETRHVAASKALESPS
jgi:hypothetical protein